MRKWQATGKYNVCLSLEKGGGKRRATGEFIGLLLICWVVFCLFVLSLSLFLEIV